MPLALSHSVQQAWDVAQYMTAMSVRQVPRFTGSTAESAAGIPHDTKCSMYGATVNGIVLGAPRQ